MEYGSIKKEPGNTEEEFGTVSDDASIVAMMSAVSWLEGSPVALVASAVFAPAKEAGVGVVLEFQNLSEKSIRHLYFSMTCVDVNGEKVRHDDGFAFLDLCVGTGETFGLDNMVRLPEAGIRNFAIYADKVVYTDGSVWENETDKPLAPLPEPVPVSSLGKSESLYRQMVPEKEQRFLAESHGSWWRCGCGQINRDLFQPCITCGASLAELVHASSLEGLDQAQKKLQKKFERKRNWGIVAGVAVCAALVTIVLTSIAVSHQNQSEVNQARREPFLQYENYSKLISTGDVGTIALCADGTVLTTNKNYYLDPTLWKDIVQVSAGSYYAGLRSDGEVVVSKGPSKAYNFILGWSHIVEISTTGNSIVGLRSDGAIVDDASPSFYSTKHISGSDFVAVAHGNSCVVGLRANGLVAVNAYTSNDPRGTSSWYSIVAVDAGNYQVVGLRSDGMVVAAGTNYQGICDVSKWSDIVAVCAAKDVTFGLRSDGTVVSTGDFDMKNSDVIHWKKVVAITASGKDHVVGLCSDGTVVEYDSDASGPSLTEGWKLF
ncbi:MAG: hypothetical protein FWD72_01290 [Eggerthellaceae bacterium]|nr:hypothetical protein [Eggerthellaceae bacterium]